jgi:hypothetical protein
MKNINISKRLCCKCCHLLGYSGLQSVCGLTFQRKAPPPASPATRWFLGWLTFELEDSGDTFLRNVGSHTDYTALYPKKMATYLPLWEPQIRRIRASAFLIGLLHSFIADTTALLTEPISNSYHNSDIHKDNPRQRWYTARRHQTLLNLWNSVYRAVTA